MTKHIVLAAASAVALLSCGSEPVVPVANNAPRNVDVYVMSDGPKCAIVVVPDWLHFPNSGHGNAFPIIWHLRTKGYKFAQNNNLSDPRALPGSPPGVISGCASGGLTMQCTNKDTAKGTWKYDVKGVTTDSGCNPPDLDPLISND